MLGTITCLSCPVAAEKPSSFTVTENGAGHAADGETFSVGVREPLASELGKGFATKTCSVEATKTRGAPICDGGCLNGKFAAATPLAVTLTGGRRGGALS